MKVFLNKVTNEFEYTRIKLDKIAATEISRRFNPIFVKVFKRVVDSVRISVLKFFIASKKLSCNVTQ